jgi:hypothetical protein
VIALFGSLISIGQVSCSSGIEPSVRVIDQFCVDFLVIFSPARDKRDEFML